VECERFQAKLKKQGCERYQKRNPDACRGCAKVSGQKEKPWTKETILQAFEDCSRRAGRRVPFREFSRVSGLSFDVIRGKWGSWRVLCEAAGTGAYRRNEPSETGGTTRSGRITLDLRTLPALHDALEEEAHKNGRNVESQILSMLKGWFS
jgi:hypothetical protein